MEEAEAVVRHYETIDEERRLFDGPGRLELARTQEILRRHLPAAPAQVLDVGGGPGTHAAWLAADGHRVHVVDLIASHVDTVRRTLGPAGVTAEVGDARGLSEPDSSVDVVLLLGPLYHLPAAADRRLALDQARRVLRPGGLVAVAGINRFASLFDGLVRGFLFEPAFRAIVARDLADGRHENPDDNPHWFTTAYFHRPEELGSEVAAAGFDPVEVMGVEGLPGWLENCQARWEDAEDRRVILEAARCVESEPTLLGLSAHLLAVGRAPV